jgi:mannosidase alpha-like ER degradation enhancer 1
MRKADMQWRPTQFRTLQTLPSSTIDSLQAFVSGMQVLAGDLDSAIQGHLVFWNLWQRYSALPESWDWQDRTILWGGWPGRPEFIESTYYLYTVRVEKWEDGDGAEGAGMMS